MTFIWLSTLNLSGTWWGELISAREWAPLSDYDLASEVVQPFHHLLFVEAIEQPVLLTTAPPGLGSQMPFHGTGVHSWASTFVTGIVALCSVPPG